jgi:hypothetical protein
MSEAFSPSGLTFRQRGILVTAAASALGDSYCSLVWGGKLSKASDAAVAAGVLTGSDAGLTDQEKAMAAWARKVARDPNATTPGDIQALRDAGLDDGQIFAITAFVAFRLAFSMINDSLGAQPDAELAQSLPRDVREAGGSGGRGQDRRPSWVASSRCGPGPIPGPATRSSPQRAQSWPACWRRAQTAGTRASPSPRMLRSRSLVARRLSPDCPQPVLTPWRPRIM